MQGGAGTDHPPRAHWRPVAHLHPALDTGSAPVIRDPGSRVGASIWRQAQKNGGWSKQGAVALKVGSAYNHNQAFNMMERLRMSINKDLLDILACPKCKGALELTDAGDGLVCQACKLIYRIKDSIPVMLIDEAEKLDKTGE